MCFEQEMEMYEQELADYQLDEMMGEREQRMGDMDYKANKAGKGKEFELLVELYRKENGMEDSMEMALKTLNL